MTRQTRLLSALAVFNARWSLAIAGSSLKLAGWGLQALWGVWDNRSKNIYRFLGRNLGNLERAGGGPAWGLAEAARQRKFC